MKHLVHIIDKKGNVLATFTVGDDAEENHRGSRFSTRINRIGREAVKASNRYIRLQREAEKALSDLLSCDVSCMFQKHSPFEMNTEGEGRLYYQYILDAVDRAIKLCESQGDEEVITVTMDEFNQEV